MDEVPWDQIHQAIGEGGKVLWVSNTVKRCIEHARQASALDIAPVIVSHSRYRYVDRVQRHGEIIDAFQSNGPVLATTTQVCEVSLDISADLLITDLAPVPALIQRLGRLNPTKERKPCIDRVLFPGLMLSHGLQGDSRHLYSRT